ncbi:MAG TPA: amino acid ABC transporter permease [Propioniciclava sp.]|jgi:glutamate transport system permease protein|uniref:amino acid ABC transporter permease n=1 Tax=Propioniciclava sp. TaxID=2038686 RepID=UPI002BF1A6AA|nr:amino acid ABC transporter permease [Propioniciclava sp.]HRL50221.1 amino acid ABC transporter permease [Propioniciclava sp.]HRL80299.1 amino acid ABC transporter permease [Propioniciclava sp.]
MSAEASVLFDAPGPKARARYRLIAVAGSVLLVALLGWLVLRLADWPAPIGRTANNQWAPEKWLPFLQPQAWTSYLLPGLWGTVLAAVTAVVASLFFGLLLGIGRLVQVRWVRWLCGAFVEFFRAVPVLMMMLFAYYTGLYLLRITGSALPFFGVVVGLTLYNSCVIAELVRSGVNNLPKGQREAGLAIGLTPLRTLVTILLPQAITAMLPSMVSQLVVILKDSALGSMISYLDLMRSGTYLSTAYANLIPTMIVLAAMYIVLNSALTRLAGWIQHRLQRGPRNVSAPITGGMVPQVASEPVVPATIMPPPDQHRH